VKIGRKKMPKGSFRSHAVRYEIGKTFWGNEIIISDAGIRMCDFGQQCFVTMDVRKVSGFTLAGVDFKVDMRYDGRRKRWKYFDGKEMRSDKELLLASRGIIVNDSNYFPVFALCGDYIITGEKT
jgi:hypothetical protein